jgi:hypothetical protein
LEVVLREKNYHREVPEEDNIKYFVGIESCENRE